MNSQDAAQDSADSLAKFVPPTRREIFLAFLKIGISAFGGAFPWVRRVVVEQRKWLTDRELTEIITVCQAVPGPNVVNTSVFIGAKFRGASGALAAFLGLVGGPLCLLLVINAAYHEVAHVAAAKSAMKGMAIVATAYLFAMSLKLAQPFRAKLFAVLLCAAALILSAVFHWHMAYVLLACGAVGILLSKAGRL
jgi:chromate transporter